MRVLAAALGRHVADRAFENLQKGLLHALAGNVAGDADIFRLASDLVDFVDINDPHLRAFDIVIGVLHEAKNDVLHILADIARFRDGRRIGDAERHIEDARQCTGQQGFSGARRADQEDVALFNLNVGQRAELLPPPVGKG